MSFAHLLTDTINVASASGVTSAGDPSYGSPTAVKARVEHGTKVIIASDGTRKEVEQVIITAVEIALDARIWLPGDSTSDAGLARRPIRVVKASRPGDPNFTLYETYL